MAKLCVMLCLIGTVQTNKLSAEGIAVKDFTLTSVNECTNLKDPSCLPITSKTWQNAKSRIFSLHGTKFLTGVRITVGNVCN